METSEAVPEQTRQKLMALRMILLNLHKALLDSERTAYEISHGAIASPAAFLQLLINDSSFKWLRPITTLIVQIDETLAAKNSSMNSWQWSIAVTPSNSNNRRGYYNFFKIWQEEEY